MAEFDYKQRPFTKRLTDAEYDRAVGRTLVNTAGRRFQEVPCPCPQPCGYRHYEPESVPDATGDSLGS